MFNGVFQKYGFFWGSPGFLVVGSLSMLVLPSLGYLGLCGVVAPFHGLDVGGDWGMTIFFLGLMTPACRLCGQHLTGSGSG